MNHPIILGGRVNSNKIRVYTIPEEDESSKIRPEQTEREKLWQDKDDARRKLEEIMKEEKKGTKADDNASDQDNPLHAYRLVMSHTDVDYFRSMYSERGADCFIEEITSKDNLELKPLNNNSNIASSSSSVSESEQMETAFDDSEKDTPLRMYFRNLVGKR